MFDPYSDPYFEKTTEPDDFVSKGFLADKKLAEETRNHAHAEGCRPERLRRDPCGRRPRRNL